MNKLVYNERHKMFASFFNSIAVFSFGTGVAIPAITVVLHPKRSSLHHSRRSSSVPWPLC